MGTDPVPDGIPKDRLRADPPYNPHEDRIRGGSVQQDLSAALRLRLDRMPFRRLINVIFPDNQ